MGIHGLGPLLKAKAPNAFVRTHAASLRQKHIAIDATLVVYSFIAKAFTTKINELPDERLTCETIFEDAERHAIVENAFISTQWLIERMQKFGIIPVLVFDGTAVPEKQSYARVRRAKRRDDAIKRIADLREQIRDAAPSDPILASLAANGSLADDRRQLRTLLRQAQHINPAADIARVRKFATETLRVRCIDAPDEAERFCAFLAKSGRVAAAYTTDSDAIAFGAPLIFTNFSPDGFFETIDTPEIFRSLGLTHAQFVDLCILLGCDFNNSVPGIGPVTALELIIAARDTHVGDTRLIEHIVADAGKCGKPRTRKVAIKSFASIESAGLVEALAAERCRDIFLDPHSTLGAAVAAAVLTHEPPPVVDAGVGPAAAEDAGKK